MAEPGKPASKWLWIIILIILLVLVIGWFLNPMGDVEQAPPAEPVAQSTEWAPAPEGDAVPVTLPESTLAPAAEAPTGGEGSSSGVGE